MILLGFQAGGIKISVKILSPPNKKPKKYFLIRKANFIIPFALPMISSKNIYLSLRKACVTNNFNISYIYGNSQR